MKNINPLRAPAEELNLIKNDDNEYEGIVSKRTGNIFINLH